MEKITKKEGKIVLAFKNKESQLKEIYTSDIEENILQDMILFMEQDSEVSINYLEEDLDLIDVLECREVYTKEESKEDCGIEWEKTEQTMNDILNIIDPIRSKTKLKKVKAMEKITKKDIVLIIIIFIFAFVMGMLFQYFIN